MHPIEEPPEVDFALERAQKALTQDSLGHKRDVINIQLDPNSLKPGLSCRKIGSLDNGYIFVTHPMVKGKLASVRHDQNVMVKAFDGLNFTQYPAIVEKVYYVPEPFVLLQVRHHSEVETRAIREHRRVPATFQVTVKLDGNGKEFQGVMTDVSMGGGKLLVQELPPEQVNRVKLTVDVPHKEWIHTIEIDCEVRKRNSDVLDEGEICSLGVQFLNLDQQADLVLSNYIASQLLALLDQ